MAFGCWKPCGIMKKLLFSLAIVICAITASAQNQAQVVKVYGVDFYATQVYGAAESPAQFAKAFTGMNQLLITEAKKYDFSRIIPVPISVNVAPMVNRVNSRHYKNFYASSNVVESIPVKEIVQSYELPDVDGVGCVLIAKLLNKVDAIGEYELVVFDIATREILYAQSVSGKAGGFGLRNYWAQSFHEIITDKKLRVTF